MKSSYSLDASDARRLVDFAVEAAESIGVPQCIAVVDMAGHLLCFFRMDGAKYFTVDFAIAKSKTAAGLSTTTEHLATVAQPNQRGFGINTISGGVTTIVGGGMPISFRGKTIGALGVSSGSVGEDIEVCRTAIHRFESELVADSSSAPK